MPTIIPTDRNQLTFMSSLDDMVAPDHPVRLIDALIDRIIEHDSKFFHHLAPQSSVGRRGYSAAALIKLYMYGYIHGFSSSRKLEGEATRNIEVIWLLSGLKPSYKTIADYRRDYPEQISVDSASKMIVAASATDHPIDFEQLTPMFWSSAARLGKIPGEVLADTGYADLGDVKTLEEQTTTTCYIPENNTSVKNLAIQFTCRPESDQYECSQGQLLVPTSKGRYATNKQDYVDIYRGTGCTDCPVAGQCTTRKSGIRQLKVYHGAGWRYSYARRMGSWYGKQRTAERKGLVEHAFGTLHYWMGQIPLKLRGLRKVQTEIDLYSGAYNLKRWVSKDMPFTILMEDVAGWNPTPSLQPG